MTLRDFNKATAGLPGETPLKVLAPWGEISDAILIARDDLMDDDPVKEAFPDNILLIAESAD